MEMVTAMTAVRQVEGRVRSLVHSDLSNSAGREQSAPVGPAV